MHYMFSHIDHFPDNFGSMSDEQGEWFHQDMKEMDVRYQDAGMQLCWTSKRETLTAEHSRWSKKMRFMP